MNESVNQSITTVPCVANESQVGSAQ